ncbi:hypothetical protein [Pseudalkalibacillus hwajinpoensis]|uniref:hypothetical protein n=1 Tax=Guptibacillus hwajinpoensis TaxID=208199 RepID=UPI001CD3F703|nr:hypothetical protein [Pseudalkalibacillus hwajinpoensis]MCA0993382.1 hypothetical protein [Pseudalkalibacillus hwajinpoensis]
MSNVFNIGTSVPAQGSGSLNRTVTGTPILLAQFGLAVPQGANRVLLSATVGVRSSLLTPVLIFTILRGNQVIYTSREAVLLSVGQEQTVTVHAIDMNVPDTSNQGYSLTVELENSLLTGAVVTGPVEFLGVSYTF